MMNPGDEPIPGYRLIKFLGKGTFGEVWQASSPGGAQIALKFLDLADKQGWKEFHAIERIKKIRHANLLHIHALWLLDGRGEVLDYDSFDTHASTRGLDETIAPRSAEPRGQPRQLVVATGLADGTLRDRLQVCQGQNLSGIPVEELTKYMEDAARGLDFLNAQRHDIDGKIVALQHCDVKPANLMLMGDSCIVGDFGLVSILSKQGVAATATGMVGSLAYMSPECIRKKPGAASDQYSLAISYYELRTGKLPFDADDPLSVAEAHLRGKLDFQGLIPDEEKVLRRATASKPAARFATSLEMVEALCDAVMPGIAPSRPGWKWAMAATWLLLGVGGLVWWTQRPEGSPDPDTDPITNNNTNNGSGTNTVSADELLDRFRNALSQGDRAAAKVAFQQMGDEARQEARWVSPRRLAMQWSSVKGLFLSSDGNQLVAVGLTADNRSSVMSWPVASLDAVLSSENQPSLTQPPIDLNLLASTAVGGNRRCVVAGKRANDTGEVFVVAIVDPKTRQVVELEVDADGTLIDPYVALNVDESLVVLTGSHRTQPPRLWGWRLSGAAPPERLAVVELEDLRFPEALAFSGDGRTVLVGGETVSRAGAVFGMDTKDWTAQQAPAGGHEPMLTAEKKVIRVTAAGSDRALVASYGDDADRFQMFSIAQRQLQAELAPVPGQIVRLAAQGAAGELWMACGSNVTVHQHHTAGATGAVAAWHLPQDSSEPRLALRGNPRYTKDVKLLTFAEGNPGWLVVACRPVNRTATGEATLDIWSLQSKAATPLSVELAQEPVALTAAGRWIAVAMSGGSPTTGTSGGYVIELFDLRQLQVLHELNQTPILISPTANPVALR